MVEIPIISCPINASRTVRIPTKELLTVEIPTVERPTLSSNILA